MREIKIYSTPTCPYCKMVKEYLESRSIPYTNYDVSEDKSALEEMIKLSGQMGVPVVVIDDEIVIGFDKSRIDPLLEEQDKKD